MENGGSVTNAIRQANCAKGHDEESFCKLLTSFIRFLMAELYCCNAVMEEDIRHGVVTQLTTEEKRPDVCYKRILIFTE